MYKERKIQKDKAQSVKEWKNTKIQSAFLEVMEKYKKIQKYKVYLFCIYFDFLLFCVFLPQKVQTKYEKKSKINTNAIFQKYKAQKKNTNQKFQKYKIKTNTNPKFQKYKIQKIYEFKNEPESQPHVHFEKQEPTCKLNVKPTCCIF